MSLTHSLSSGTSQSTPRNSSRVSLSLRFVHRNPCSKNTKVTWPTRSIRNLTSKISSIISLQINQKPHDPTRFSKKKERENIRRRMRWKKIKRIKRCNSWRMSISRATYCLRRWNISTKTSSEVHHSNICSRGNTWSYQRSRAKRLTVRLRSPSSLANK